MDSNDTKIKRVKKLKDILNSTVTQVTVVVVNKTSPEEIIDASRIVPAQLPDGSKGVAICYEFDPHEFSKIKFKVATNGKGSASDTVGYEVVLESVSKGKWYQTAQYHEEFNDILLNLQKFITKFYEDNHFLVFTEGSYEKVKYLLDCFDLKVILSYNKPEIPTKMVNVVKIKEFDTVGQLLNYCKKNSGLLEEIVGNNWLRVEFNSESEHEKAVFISSDMFVFQSDLKILESI